jgi:hypothetical protein
LIVYLYGNIFGKYGHVEPGLGAMKSYPAFLIDLYRFMVTIEPGTRQIKFFDTKLQVFGA